MQHRAKSGLPNITLTDCSDWSSFHGKVHFGMWSFIVVDSETSLLKPAWHSRSVPCPRLPPSPFHDNPKVTCRADMKRPLAPFSTSDVALYIHGTDNIHLFHRAPYSFVKSPKMATWHPQKLELCVVYQKSLFARGMDGWAIVDEDMQAVYCFFR